MSRVLKSFAFAILALVVLSQANSGYCQSTAAMVMSAATGESSEIDASIGQESQYAGPMAGGTRGVDAARDMNKSVVPRMFEPGSHNYRPRYIIPSPLTATRPNTFNNRFVSWRLGYKSDGFRGAYFR